MMNLLVTGGCGFIGSNFIKMVLAEPHRDLVAKVVNLDALTYAGDLENTKDFHADDKYVFEEVNLCNPAALLRVFVEHGITHVVHLAAESHVDNSILDPSAFVDSNILGTFNLLKIARQLKVERFHHVSTDEVYGELGETGKFDENTAYDPRNPYSASKAASDFLVMSYFHTYKLPVTISNCSNNYGPHQHDEKFIPTVIRSLTNKKKIPLYGAGLNVRDWIYVGDHCEGIWKVLEDGVLGETYCIGSNCEKRNVEVIDTICTSMGVVPSEWVEHVEDRLSHDYRYAIDNTKIKEDLNWSPRVTFEEGIQKTIDWYNEKY
jgi:dTDP-glucose 4,6-dehydratase